MKTMKNYIWMAAIAMTVATFMACSNNDLATNEAPVQKNNIVTLTATLGPKGGDATTRALTDPDDGTISSAWAVDEEICVEYTDAGENFVDAKGIITAVDGDGKATVTVNLVNPKEGDTDIYFHYPYSIAKGIKDLNTDQIGTLDDIAANFDDFDGDGTLSVSAGVATLPSDVTMTRNVSIWKLAFKVGGSDITNTITALNINIGDGAREYDVTPYKLDAIYVALGNVSNTNVTITAATSLGNYSFTKDNVTLEPGYFYRSTVTLTAAAASGTYRVYSDRTNFDNVPIPVGATTITSETTVWAAGTYVVSSDVTITEDVLLTGDVNLILCDGAELTVNGCIFGGEDYDHGFVYKLNIFCQALGTGKLTVDYSGSHSLGVVTANELNIHGGVINVGGTGVYQGLEPNVFNVYHGTINACGIVSGIALMGNAHIYGGNITSIGNYQAAINLPNGGKTLTISGGTVTAVNNGASTGIETVYGLVITGGSVTALGGNNAEGILSYGNITISGGNITTIAGKSGIGLEGTTITVSGGDVKAIGGSAHADSNGDGMAGIDGTLTVTGGIVTAIGGAKDGTGTDGLGISGGSTIALTGVTMYEGDSANPSTPAASQTACTKQYVIIQ